MRSHPEPKFGLLLGQTESKDLGRPIHAVNRPTPLVSRGGFLPRPPERTHAQINKHHHHTRRHQKLGVIGAVHPARPDPPQRGTKHHQWQQKEDSHHLEPQNPAHAPERPQKSPNTARQASRNTRGRSASSPPAHLCILCLVAHRRINRCTSALCAVADVLAGHASCDTQSDSQHPSDGLRSHFDMMVAATVGKLPDHSLPVLPVALGPLQT